MSREKDVDLILNVFYGAPGESHDTEAGRALLMEILDEMGLSALRDDAVARLAAKHRAADDADRFRKG